MHTGTRELALHNARQHRDVMRPFREAVLTEGRRLNVRAYAPGQQRLTPPPLCNSHALVQATVGVGTVLIWYLILIRYQM